jgi:hypothetical protein
MADQGAAGPTPATAAPGHGWSERRGPVPPAGWGAGGGGAPPESPPDPAVAGGDREGEARQRTEAGQDVRSEQGEQDQQTTIPGADQVKGFAQPYLGATEKVGMRVDGDVTGGTNYGTVEQRGRENYLAETINRIVVPNVGGSRVAVGSVEPRLLDKVASVLVAPAVAGQALGVLREQRVLILRGRPHWGKSSLALWLLGRVGRQEHEPTPEVYALGPTVSLHDLPEGFLSDNDRPSGRYVIDTLSPETAGTLRLPILRALCRDLGDGYLVITVDSRTPIPRIELGDYLVDCEEPPDPEAVLRHNLRWRLDGAEPPAALFEVPWVRRELDGKPLPGYLDQLGDVLTMVAKGLTDPTTAEADYTRLLGRRVAEWFESHPDLPERCLMVAAAVLNGASYHEVADAADQLRTLLEPPNEDDALPQPPGWGLSSSRHQLVEDLGARVLTQLQPTSLGPCPVELLELEDPRLQPQVLDHVWVGHDAVRGTLLDWLERLGHHSIFDVHGRAAAAVGALCRKDLPYLHNRLLLEWATAEGREARISAAVALDVVAGDPDLARQVRALLHQWIQLDPGSRQAWTATVAYGFGVGQRWPKFALRDLRLVVEQAPHHAWVASQSLASLCEAGKASTVLDAIADWAAIDDPPDAAEPVLRVFLRMLMAANANVLTAGADGNDTVPTLLRLAAKDGEHRSRVVELWKQAFQRVDTSKEAVGALRRWILLADERTEVQQTLDPVAGLLLRGDHGYQADLADVLRELAEDLRRPSTNARRYLQGIGQEVTR